MDATCAPGRGVSATTRHGSNSVQATDVERRGVRADLFLFRLSNPPRNSSCGPAVLSIASWRRAAPWRIHSLLLVAHIMLVATAR